MCSYHVHHDDTRTGTVTNRVLVSLCLSSAVSKFPPRAATGPKGPPLWRFILAFESIDVARSTYQLMLRLREKVLSRRFATLGELLRESGAMATM